MELSLSRRTIVQVLIVTACVLLIASIAGQFTKHVVGHPSAYGLVPLFYVDDEGNIPTFFSSILLLLASLLLALIATHKNTPRNSYPRHWMILSLILLYMAIDESVMLHEKLNRAGWWLGDHPQVGIFHYGWVIFGIVAVGVVALSHLKFFRSLPSLTQKQFFTAAAVFLSGAIGVEILEGNYAGSHGGEDSFQFSMLTAVEEGLEMAGVIILINALLTYLIDHCEIHLSLTHSRGSSSLVASTNKSGIPSQS